MLKFYSIDDLVERRDCSVFRSDDEEYRNYVFSVFKLFRRKLIEGSLLDCERISRQVEQILKEAARFHPSPLLVSELRIMFLELFLKRKNRNRFQEFYRLLRTSLRQLRPEDREVQLVKINSLILYDPDFEVMPHQGEHSSVEAVSLHREGRTFQAIELLKHYLNEYGQYVATKKVLIGKWLLELSKPEAFEWLYEVLQLQKHEFERYEARVLFVSGYRALTERMGYDLSKCRLKNLNELQKNYTEEMRRLNEQCSLKNIEEFKKEYGMGFDPKLGIIERKTHLSKALDLVAKLPCFPNPSVYEFDCRVKLIQDCIDTGSFDECKGNIEIVIEQGNELDIFNWKREMKVSQCLATVLEHQGNFGDAMDLIDRCMELEQDRNKKVSLGDWKASVKSKVSGKASRTVEIAFSRDERPIKGKPEAVEGSKARQVQGGKLVHGSNKDRRVPVQEQTAQASSPPQVQQKSCCSLM